MADEMRQRVLDVLEQEGPELPVAVLARRVALPPTRLVAILDDLHDEGRVTTGPETHSVALVPAPQGDGRFARPAATETSRRP